MGIAGFYLWLQRWYGDCIQDVPESIVDAALKGHMLSEKEESAMRRYDNLYLDMNGLIHPCCHDTNPLPEPESEEEMFERIFAQMDLLYKVVRPRKCLVLCVDGVAPQSKMNQQRSRRFRAAEERLESDALSQECAEAVMKKGLPRPNTRDRWDHNVITPSTAFMERVGLAIEWFVMKKLNEDPDWRHITVIFSDAHVPGEGEHKIMQYIRGLRSQPGYDPHTSHVIHGMDADLICLGLSTHEEHVTILRNQLTDTYQPDHNRFCYFSLYKYRQRLKEDFSSIGKMNFERVLDDFVFLCFFVGNDFLPHVPLISIKTKGIELLLDHYVRSFETHSYLTNKGEVNYNTLSKFLRSFVQNFMVTLKREYGGVLRAKERAKVNVEERIKRSEEELNGIYKSFDSKCSDVQEISDAAHKILLSILKERTRLVADKQPLGFSYVDDNHRDGYYENKFGWNPENREEFEENIKLCCAEYLRGTQWVMRYYTTGCPSWDWYYPFHYAPLLQDLAQFTDVVNVEMSLGTPRHPVVQLLAVLPRLSVHALPEELHEAVKDPASVLGAFYPDKVDVDFSEAYFSYQGVLRLPFIDSVQLQLACQKIVELEPDHGVTLLLTHESSILSRSLEQLLGKEKEGKGKNTTTLHPIPRTISMHMPIAGSVGYYEMEWPRHAKLECPDPGMAKDTSYGKPIKDNAVRCYHYEMKKDAKYKPELLRSKRDSSEVTSSSPTRAVQTTTTTKNNNNNMKKKKHQEEVSRSKQQTTSGSSVAVHRENKDTKISPSRAKRGREEKDHDEKEQVLTPRKKKQRSESNEKVSKHEPAAKKKKIVNKNAKRSSPPSPNKKKLKK
ncbi:putative 5-3 exonuclease XRNA [Trypanosoma theileri]|uniref:Putative 5-3 exonuclease XRNA n=1 Tax=Trypanosoma theileri TaxID=67003 RepID=A0A1X0P7T7_9TRYP|nr:putative 5-3 exonuclease XRNA [Trypanosoma theileri]ORC93002.1 putative 5-3 exonuclease XRNA [Trypanosoma theileri]